MHGARAVLRHLKGKTDAWSCWLKGVEERRGTNRACVAHANKVARVAWVLLARGERYRPAWLRRAQRAESRACNASDGKWCGRLLHGMATEMLKTG